MSDIHNPYADQLDRINTQRETTSQARQRTLNEGKQIKTQRTALKHSFDTGKIDEQAFKTHDAILEKRFEALKLQVIQLRAQTADLQKKFAETNTKAQQWEQQRDAKIAALRAKGNAALQRAMSNSRKIVECDTKIAAGRDTIAQHQRSIEKTLAEMEQHKANIRKLVTGSAAPVAGSGRTDVHPPYRTSKNTTTSAAAGGKFGRSPPQASDTSQSVSDSPPRHTHMTMNAQ